MKEKEKNHCKAFGRINSDYLAMTMMHLFRKFATSINPAFLKNYLKFKKKLK